MTNETERATYGIIFIQDGRVLTSQGDVSAELYSYILGTIKNAEILYEKRDFSLSQLKTFVDITAEIRGKQADMAMRDRIKGLVKKLEVSEK